MATAISQLADLLALSITMVFNVPSLREAVHTVRARSHRPVPVAIGGNVFSTSLDLAEGIAAELVAGDSQAFIQQLDRFFGERA
jgi:methanogenic corrinoid protein MtbC1